MDIAPFKGQKYEELLEQHSASQLFEDPFFPVNDKALYYSQAAPSGIVWKRPKQVRRDAQFVVDGFGRCDMDQGYVGNCWFIAGCVGIMQSPKMFARVVPANQSFTDNYAGIFHFRFWLYGQWVDVVIDDRLPFWQKNGSLVFANNKEQPNEFWAPLLEKAYAKLYGNYENLEAGQTTDALIDMSGGLQEQFELSKMDANEKQSLWTILYQSYHRNSIMGCSITPNPSVKEAKLANGLVCGHAYTITKLASFDLRGRTVQLIRIRNPWGNEVEWKGAWSDNSNEWNAVSSDLKQEIGLVSDHDGEFWMSFVDFLTNWHTVQICHLSANSFSDELTDNVENFSWRNLAAGDSAWNCAMYQSEWRAGKSAGGCGQPNQSSFWKNPQFLIRLDDVDHDDNQNKATVIVSLMQKDSRLKRLKTKAESAEEYIQFRLFRIKPDVEVDETRSSGLKLYSNQLDRIGTSGSYINSREVTKRFRVEPGNYLVIPSTYEEDRNCEFLLRVFTEEPIESINLNGDKQEELSEDESFFEVDENDQIFNSWSNFYGSMSGGDEGDSEEQSQEDETASESTPRRVDVKQACNLM